MFKNHGFSLIELMIVVAIVAILAAVAIPSYQSFVQDGRRAEGVALAMDVAARQERFYTQNAQYTAALGSGGLEMPRLTSESGNYTARATVVSSATSTYTITVDPTGWTDGECESLTLTNTGIRGVTKTGATSADIAECWQ